VNPQGIKDHHLQRNNFNGNDVLTTLRVHQTRVDQRVGDKVTQDKLLLILGFNGGYLLILILFLDIYTVSMWAMSTFRRYMLPSSCEDRGSMYLRNVNNNVHIQHGIRAKKFN
jgi:hypothetical protein